MTTPEILKENEKYAANFDKPDFSHFKNVVICGYMQSSERYFVLNLGCLVAYIDPRIDPYTQLGLKAGDAIIIRNAGGVALRLVPSDDGGSPRPGEENPGRDDVAKIVDAMDFHHIIDPVESVKKDVKFLSEHPLVIKGTMISGWLYDVDTGKISQILEVIA
ncbi:carbonic anhydrase family protein [Mycena metata]|uniref:Carbonic anhydrase family protein n=1 Tax=Mycena metata TaxID=1033252 RepID=A0AAD7P353_9AGAR|nr:carbonic anhydrase family protein [Mycena metata]